MSLCPPRSIEEGKFEDIGSWAMVTGMRDTDDNARAIFEAWRDGTKLCPDIKMTAIDAWIDGLPHSIQADIDAGKYDPTLDFQ